MVRPYQKTQDKLLAFLRSIAYDRQREMLYLPSVGWIAARSGLAWHVVDNCLDYLDLIGKISVSRINKGLWVDLQPNAY